eukprot:Amastigsp_a842391_175.p2 type:complete len:112 gc:universal Amastigsp_a842391_175:166-501(+)
MDLGLEVLELLTRVVGCRRRRGLYVVDRREGRGRRREPSMNRFLTGPQFRELLVERKHLVKVPFCVVCNLLEQLRQDPAALLEGEKILCLEPMLNLLLEHLRRERHGGRRR